MGRHKNSLTSICVIFQHTEGKRYIFFFSVGIQCFMGKPSTAFAALSCMSKVDTAAPWVWMF